MSAPRVIPLRPEAEVRYRFEDQLQRHGLQLPPEAVATLQVNLTKLCNQACRHCHVDASPARTEEMSRANVERVLDILGRHAGIAQLDLTGGAPELHPDFDWLVGAARRLGRNVMARHNLTVQFDGHPRSGARKDYLPGFFAEHGVEVTCSLPYYQEYFTDAQRGKGVFAKSIEGLRRLNAVGYGQEGSGLVLNLVYNPVGPYLPAAQAALEADYKRELGQRFGIRFNRLFTITNMPIHRFRLHLEKSGQYGSYMDKLLDAFNPAAAAGVMCRTLISVGWNGRLYDCDFNQQLELPILGADGAPATLDHFDLDGLLRRRIRFASHCLACTAGAGSSCAGATA